VTNESLLSSVTLLITTLGLRVAVSTQWNHLDGLFKVAFKAMQPSTRIAQKVAACELVATLGERLREAAEHVVPAYQVSNPPSSSIF
jgi:hypothetical protein